MSELDAMTPAVETLHVRTRAIGCRDKSGEEAPAMWNACHERHDAVLESRPSSQDRIVREEDRIMDGELADSRVWVSGDIDSGMGDSSGWRPKILKDEGMKPGGWKMDVCAPCMYRWRQ
jgi:hypothetical protein